MLELVKLWPCFKPITEKSFLNCVEYALEQIDSVENVFHYGNM